MSTNHRVPSRLAASAVSLVAVLAFPANALVLTIGGAGYVGYVQDGVGNPTEQAAYLNSLITLGAGTTSTPCPGQATETCNRTLSTLNGLQPVTVTGNFKQDNGNTLITFNPGDGPQNYDYVIGKYDAGNAGMAVWYIGNYVWSAGETLTLPADFQPFAQQGLSHTTLYVCSTASCDPPRLVAEPEVLGMLGLGLLLLAGVARRQRERNAV